MDEPAPRPKGQPIEWTNEIIEEMATVRASDLAAGEMLWQNNAPAPIKKLLTADVKKTKKQKRNGNAT
jgi:hypothetical protein